MKVWYGLIIFFALWLLCMPAMAGEKEPKVFLVSAPPDSAVQFYHTIKDDTLTLDKPGEFDVQVKVEPAAVHRDIISSQYNFSFPESEFVCRDCPCRRSWKFDLQGLSFMDYPHLQLAWQQSSFDPVPDVTVQMDLQAGKKSKQVQLKGEFRGTNSLHLVPKLQLDMRSAEYVEKSRIYLVKREMGWKADSRWRYSQDGTDLVLQARVEQPLRDIQVVQVVLSRQQTIERVNFSLDVNGNGRRDRFILFDELKHSMEEKNGRSILTIDLRNFITAHHIDTSKAALTEVILFLPTTIHEYRRKKPLYSVGFFNAGGMEDEMVVSPRLTQQGGRYVLDFDFAKNNFMGDLWDAKYRTMTISVLLPGPQVLSWKQARLFGVQKGAVPKLALQPDAVLREWSGNMAIHGEYERVASFRPLLRVRQEAARPDAFSRLEQITRAHYKDMDVELSTTDNAWYLLKKEAKIIDIQSFFTSPDSVFRLKILPREDDATLSLSGDSVSLFVVERFDGKALDLPLKFFMHGSQLVLPARKEVVLRLSPELAASGNIPGAPGSRSDQNFAVQNWRLRMKIKGEGSFGSSSSLASATPHNLVIWQNPTSHVVRGKLWPYIRVGKGLAGNIITKQDGKIVRYPVVIDKSSALMDTIPPGARLVGFEVPCQESRCVQGMDVVFFDIETQDMSLHPALDGSEWWYREGDIALKARDAGVKTDAKSGVAYLFVQDQSKRKWRFFLPPEVDFIQPLYLRFPEAFPAGVKATVIIGRERFPLKENQRSFPLQDTMHGKDLQVEIEYAGNEKCVAVPLPYLHVFGLRQTGSNGMEGLSVTVGSEKFSVSSADLSVLGESKIDLGRIRLEQGVYPITFSDNNFFHIDSVILQTESWLPFLDITDGKTAQAPSLWTRLALFAVRLFSVVLLASMVYVWRRKISRYFHRIFDPLWCFFKKCYLFVPDDALTLFWFLAGCGLYGIGLSQKVIGEDYGATFGGLCMVLFFWHLCRALKGVVRRSFPKFFRILYGSASSPFFSGAIVFLVMTAIPVAMRLEPIAEQFAVVVYYFLVAGVAVEVIHLKTHRAELEN